MPSSIVKPVRKTFHTKAQSKRQSVNDHDWHTLIVLNSRLKRSESFTAIVSKWTGYYLRLLLPAKMEIQLSRVFLNRHYRNALILLDEANV